MVGIGFKLASVMVLVSMQGLLKAAEGVPLGQLVFFRAFFAIVPIIIFLALRGELSVGFKTSNPIGHVWRGVVGTGGLSFGILALINLPLPEAVAIGYATPFLIVVFSAIIFKEVVRAYRWTAVLVGLVGVMIIIWPRLTVFDGGLIGPGNPVLGVSAALLGCCFGAGAMLLVRNLVRTERSATIVFYFSAISALIGLATFPFGWVALDWSTTAMLVLAGVAGGVGQILLTESFRHADMSVVAPFDYSSLLISIAIGYVIFGDVPTWQMLLGGMVVVGSGLFLIFREHRSSRLARRPLPPSS
ncbi:EamA-like transporter family protein [Devosia enhydra]|uniref:EamA-like transporter family protein n=1 Tax=Devosia enhydra TaxID=665118 RepID=A0A1K2HVL6_9HYPH|nr:EamA-like transporter family protein [Devosia enhydra]